MKAKPLAVLIMLFLLGIGSIIAQNDDQGKKFHFQMDYTAYTVHNLDTRSSSNYYLSHNPALRLEYQLSNTFSHTIGLGFSNNNTGYSFEATETTLLDKEFILSTIENAFLLNTGIKIGNQKYFVHPEVAVKIPHSIKYTLLALDINNEVSSRFEESLSRKETVVTFPIFLSVGRQFNFNKGGSFLLGLRSHISEVFSIFSSQKHLGVGLGVFAGFRL